MQVGAVRREFHQAGCLHLPCFGPADKVIATKLPRAHIDSLTGSHVKPVGDDTHHRGIIEYFQQRIHIGVDALQTIVESQQHRLVRQRSFIMRGSDEVIDADRGVAVMLQPGEMRSQVLCRDRNLVGVIVRRGIIADVVIGNGDKALPRMCRQCEQRQDEQRCS